MSKVEQKISSQLKEWILTTLKSGVSPIAIGNALIKKGYNARESSCRF